MNVCIPVLEDQALASALSDHFGKTPLFMMVDSESGACRAIVNGNVHRTGGPCSPLASLQGERIDAAIVKGIGQGALNGLAAAGIPVYLTDRATLAEVVADVRAGTLTPMPADQVRCASHSHADHA